MHTLNKRHQRHEHVLLVVLWFGSMMKYKLVTVEVDKLLLNVLVVFGLCDERSTICNNKEYNIPRSSQVSSTA